MAEIKAGYKQTDSGVIPEDWDVMPLNNLCDRNNGLIRGPFGGALKKEYFSKSGYKVYTQQNAIYQNEELGGYYIPESKYKELVRFTVKQDDFIVSCSGTIGRIHKIAQKAENGIINQALLIIRTNEKILKDFFLFYFRSAEFQSLIIDSTQGGAMQNLVGMNVFRETPIILPKLEEQKAIAAVLSDVDRLIESLEQLMSKKRDIKTAAMQQLLTGKKRLPGFNGEWEKKSFDDLFLFLPTANNSRADLLDYGEVKYIHYGDIHTKWSDYVDFGKHSIPNICKEKVLNASYIKNGDLIVADASEDYEGVGKAIEVVGLLNDQLAVAGLHTYLLRQKNSLELSDGFKAYIQHIPPVKTAIQRVATGLKVYGISKGNLKEIMIALPSKEEQAAIATVLSDMDAEINSLDQRLKKTQSLKTGMMQALLTGKIRLVNG